MKFLLDENTEYRLAGFLTRLGHDVTAIAHDYPASLSDHEVLAIATREQRVLLTNDHDFGELIFNQHLPHSGVVLFRLAPGDVEAKQTWMAHLIVQYCSVCRPSPQGLLCRDQARYPYTPSQVRITDP